MALEYLIIFFSLALAMFMSVYFKKLTLEASLTGGLISLIVYSGCNYYPLLLMAVFFVLGSAATSWKIKTKQLKKTNNVIFFHFRLFFILNCVIIQVIVYMYI